MKAIATRALAAMAIAGGAMSAVAQPAPLSAKESQEARLRSERLAAFRAFAEPYLGQWNCAIEEFDASGKVVWSDTQRRVFAFSMSRHFLEERAMLKRPDGTEYEGGLHLTTWDPNSDRIVQHGFWLPRQPEPLFRITGQAKGKNFAGEMELKTEAGGVETKRLVMRWISPERWLLEAIETRPDGSQWVRERLTYTKRVPIS